MRQISINVVFFVVAFVVLAICASRSGAHPTYSQDDDDTNCRACHGDFRDGDYISPSDGQNWGNIHNLHRTDMLNGDCFTCHVKSGFFPVSIGSSGGGQGFEPIGCMGCHGREEDMGNDSISEGRGAGLRQHHFNADVTMCADCHMDADPDNYTPVGEDVAPSYYFLPDDNHPDKPTDPCSPNGEEDFAGSANGTDNDGDLLYDGDDPDCTASCPGDLDGNGMVNSADLAILLGAWGPCPGCPADLDGNGEVNSADLAILLGAWGPC